MEEFKVDDILILRKKHPCGENRWRVVRVGADIGLECFGCGRKVFISRRELTARIKRTPEKSKTVPVKNGDDKGLEIHGDI